MEKIVNELNLVDLEAVVGGVIATATAYRVPTATVSQPIRLAAPTSPSFSLSSSLLQSALRA